MIGWTGYPIDAADIRNTIANIKASGQDSYGMWVRQTEFEAKNWTSDADFALMDVAVAETEKLGMQCILDYDHNSPQSAYITAAKKQAWISKSILIGKRYKDKLHVWLHPVNEYTGTDQVALANDWFKAVRAAGIHLKVAFAFWWNQSTVALADPDNNYAVVRHLYGPLATSDMATPAVLADAIVKFGIGAIMQKYFYSTTETVYLQSIIKQKIPLGWFITELGPTDNETYVGNPSVGDMAYFMAVIRESIKNKVSFLCYRIGEYSKKATYEALAIKYFNEPLIPTQPQPPALEQRVIMLEAEVSELTDAVASLSSLNNTVTILEHNFAVLSKKVKDAGTLLSS